MPRFGAHMSIAGGFRKAVDAASALGMETVQLFTQSPSQWAVKPVAAASRKGEKAGNVRWIAPALDSAQVSAFHTAIRESGVAGPVAHGSYLINLASPDDALWLKSIEAMIVELNRCDELRVSDLVVHPGAHMGQGEDAGIRRIAEALDLIQNRTEGRGVTIDLETTAGQGSTLGHRFEHLQGIIDSVRSSEGIGVCVDTCHIFAAGYSLDRPERYDETIGQLEKTVGLHRVRVWHVNDSCREYGSRVDRHAAIGGGKMGLEPFRHLVNDSRFQHLPMILETPKGTVEGEALDARNLRTLRQLISHKNERELPRDFDRDSPGLARG